MSARRSVYADRLLEYEDIALGDEAIYRHRGGWSSFFGERMPRPNRLVLEVGCADADFLAAIAAKHPDTAFVGLDWKAKAIYVGAARIDSLGLGNVLLLRGRAQDLTRIFADGEVDEILVFHPEPCDRPEEVRNRLIAEPFLVDAHRVLSGDESSLSIKTDHAGYYQAILALFGLPEPTWTRPRDLAAVETVSPVCEAARARFEAIARSADYWNDSPILAHTAGRCFAGQTTLYERRFIKKRQPIYYFEMRPRAR